MRTVVRTVTWGLGIIVASSALSLALAGCGSSSSGSGGGGSGTGGSGTGGAGTGGAPSPCNDGVKNGAESDVDCGGPTCGKCANGKACGASGDCQSNMCNGGVCAPGVAGLVWAKRFGNNFDQSCYVVRTDASDNVITADWIQGKVDFGKGAIGSSEQIALVKLDAGGATQWSKTYPTGSKQYPYGLAVNAAGSLFLAGGFQNTLKFGAPAPDLTPVGVDDFYAASFSDQGATLWAKSFGDALQFQQFNGAATDAQGNPILTGWLNGSANFGGGTLNGANVDVVVVKLDKETGGHVFSHAYGDGNLQGGFSVAVAANGEIIVSGYLNGVVDFGGGGIGGGSNNMFLLKLDAAGSYQWAKAFPSTETELRPNAVAVDGAGNIFLGGGKRGTLNLGGGVLPTAVGMGIYDGFLAKFDSKGNHQWSKSFGDGDQQWIDSIAVDSAGNVLVVGSFSGTLNLGGEALVSQGGDEFGGDVFLGKFTTTGELVYAQRYGDGGHQLPKSITVDSTGAVVICGEFKGSIDFGGGALTSEGGNDIFVAKFTVP